MEIASGHSQTCNLMRNAPFMNQSGSNVVLFPLIDILHSWIDASKCLHGLHTGPFLTIILDEPRNDRSPVTGFHGAMISAGVHEYSQLLFHRTFH